MISTRLKGQTYLSRSNDRPRVPEIWACAGVGAEAGAASGRTCASGFGRTEPTSDSSMIPALTPPASLRSAIPDQVRDRLSPSQGELIPSLRHSREG